MNGFGSSLFKPKGRIVPRREIQILSFLFLSKRALSELDGALIKSKIKQVIWSILPVWSGRVRCLATGSLSSSILDFSKSFKCSLNRTLKSFCLAYILFTTSITLYAINNIM